MKSKLRIVLLGVLLVTPAALLNVSASKASAQDDSGGAAIYSESCASCHQANGQGVEGSFPPLAGNKKAAKADYVEMVVEDGLEGEIKVDGVTYDATMPPVEGLSDAEVDSVVEYVGTLAKTEADTSQTESKAEPGSAAEGEALFTGSTRFERGAAACSSCHTAGNIGDLGGSTLGPDLTDASEKFGGEKGLAAWLENPASETMKPVFENAAMTDSEVADVAAYLAKVPDQKKSSEPFDQLALAGGVGLLVLVGGMALAWRGMRQTYVERLRRQQ